MFPVEIYHHILSSLPVPSELGQKKVLSTLNALVTQRIAPYFRNRRGTDLIQLAQVKQNFAFQRLEDERNQIKTLTLLTRAGYSWDIRIHERFFDYLAFVIPHKPELSLVDGNVEERKIMALSEFFLRHNIEHMLYPETSEIDLIHSDIEFALRWKSDDPTAYLMLRSALGDEMNGVCGKSYLELLDSAEQGKMDNEVIERIMSRYALILSDLPEDLLEAVYPSLDKDLKTLVLGECYRSVRTESNSLTQRASSLKKIVRLFSLPAAGSMVQPTEIFDAFRRRWGIEALFRELDISQADLRSNTDDLYEMLKKRIKADQSASKRPHTIITSANISTQNRSSVVNNPPKSLKERIEDARNDPLIPQAVIDLIDKNKQNSAGQSGAKYAELIDVLLALPWGKFQDISISPEEFEEGLNRSHYGLRKPKEIICDFFANLIWRYRHYRDDGSLNWSRNGSALLFVGPPGVGKTSLAISIAKTLGIPYHKISLGGMRDESDIRGYGFTYEGSKPGPIVQGLIKMKIMNGMFILDEVDKTERSAISTLLEILDPEQNHLFHDKYTQTSVDIDLSNCHFILTANSLETVPPAVLDRCDIIFLNRYSIEEKIAIAREHLVKQVRRRYMIGEDEIFFDPASESDLLRYLIKGYTSEAGVRDLERVIRSLFLRIHRKEIIANGRPYVSITREGIEDYMEDPIHRRLQKERADTDDLMGLEASVEMDMSSLIPLKVAPMREYGERNDNWRKRSRM